MERDQGQNTDGAAREPTTSGPVVVRELEVGARIKLRGGAIAEVTANPRDGGWIFVKFVEHPDPDLVGSQELIFHTDVLQHA